MCIRVSRLIFKGLPEGIAQMRREKATELVMFGPRITLQRHKRRLIEVRHGYPTPVGAPRVWRVCLAMQACCLPSHSPLARRADFTHVFVHVVPALTCLLARMEGGC